MLTCRLCGEIYEDDNTLDQTKDGFWCDMCDTFNYPYAAQEIIPCKYSIRQ